MKKAEKESIFIAKHIHSFLTVYVPSQKSQSENTVRSHEAAISLFVGFLENEHSVIPATLNSGCFGRDIIEGWLLWLRNKRGCSPETCNVRLASLRAFLKYLGNRDVSMLHISHTASSIPRIEGDEEEGERHE